MKRIALPGGRFAGRLPSLCAILLVLCGAFVPPLSAQSGTGAPFGASAGEGETGSPAGSLVLAARDSAAMGDWQRANRILSGAVELDDGNSDALYLSALSVLKCRDDAGAALALCEAAIASGSFSLYSAQVAIGLEGELLARLRRFNDCLDLLRGFSGSPWAALDPECYRLRALAFLGLGRDPEAVRELRAAAERFPADARFPRLFFERFASFAPSAETRSLGDLFVRRLADLSSADPELLVLAAPCILDRKQREDSIRAFRAMGGRSAAATLEALRYGIIGDEAALAELFGSGERLRLADLESLSDLLGTAAGRRRLDSLLGDYGGSITVDADRDGYAEGMASYERGRLAAWRSDADQDGRAELAMSFSDGMPAGLAMDLADSRMEVVYASYPYAASVGFAPISREISLARTVLPIAGGEASVSERYFFAPESSILRPLEFRGIPSRTDPALFVPQPIASALPTRRAVSASALRLEIAGPANRDVIDLDGGIPLRRSRYAEGRLYAVLEYSKGRPDIEKLDMDGNGVFETERGYLAGADASDASIAWARIDGDGDGIYEYREEMVFPFRKEWDLDGNGLPDAVEYRKVDDGRILEFSSRMDGVLDETVACDATGRVIAVARNGKPLALVRDSNPAVFWLGKKEFDLGNNVPSSEGIYSYMNRRYRIVHSGVQAFAELIP